MQPFYHSEILIKQTSRDTHRLLTLNHRGECMRRLIAYGLALFLGLTSLGAAHRADLSEASITNDQLRLQPKPTLAGSSGMSSRNGHPYQVGTASWYGDYFQGKTTASGEPYDMNDLTAAHPSLPYQPAQWAGGHPAGERPWSGCRWTDHRCFLRCGPDFGYERNGCPAGTAGLGS